VVDKLRRDDSLELPRITGVERRVGGRVEPADDLDAGTERGIVGDRGRLSKPRACPRAAPVASASTRAMGKIERRMVSPPEPAGKPAGPAANVVWDTANPLAREQTRYLRSKNAFA
jgi:hypothetical protein